MKTKNGTGQNWALLGSRREKFFVCFPPKKFVDCSTLGLDIAYSPTFPFRKVFFAFFYFFTSTILANIPIHTGAEFQNLNLILS